MRCSATRSGDALCGERLLDRPTHALSGGQKTRVALAGVLAMEPQGILAYETRPLVSMDFVTNPHSAIVDAACTDGHQRYAGQDLRLVRQRVGLCEPLC
jgi:ABC-type arginine transport system ATPase subunit